MDIFDHILLFNNIYKKKCNKKIIQPNNDNNTNEYLK
jgi:hypothetical protein